MGSAIAPRLANIFLVYFNVDWLQNFQSGFKTHYYRRYIDEIFFYLPHHCIRSVPKIYQLLSNISFQLRMNSKIDRSFLMPTDFKWNVAHFESFPNCNIGTVCIFFHRCFGICSCWSKLHIDLLLQK